MQTAAASRGMGVCSKRKKEGKCLPVAIMMQAFVSQLKVQQQ